MPLSHIHMLLLTWNTFLETALPVLCLIMHAIAKVPYAPYLKLLQKRQAEARCERSLAVHFVVCHSKSAIDIFGSKGTGRPCSGTLNTCSPSQQLEQLPHLCSSVTGQDCVACANGASCLAMDPSSALLSSLEGSAKPPSCKAAPVKARTSKQTVC